MSLLRSCYKTDCRFFRDDLETVGKIEWYFTEPDAPWVGLDNLFNARTWYGNTDLEWPEVGEVQDAARQYSKGGNTRTGDPHGTADQWKEGALLQDAVASDPCPGPRGGVAFPANGGWYDIFGPDVRYPLIVYSPSLVYGESHDAPGLFWTFRPDPTFQPCGYRLGATCSLTLGPPDFLLDDPDVVQLANFQDCLNGTLQSQGEDIRTIVSFNVPQ